MGNKQLNLINKKFNRLLVIDKSESRKYGVCKKRMWVCLCDCGKKLIVNTSALTTGNTKSCGCLHSENSILNSKKSRYKLAKIDSGYIQIYNRYKNNAKKRNIIFEIDFDKFKDLLLSNCYYCNINPSNLYFKNYYDVYYNGIDRIDNNKGYEINNIVSCCKMCNIAKNNNSYEDFITWAYRLINYQNIQKLKQNETKKTKNAEDMDFVSTDYEI